MNSPDFYWLKVPDDTQNYIIVKRENLTEVFKKQIQQKENMFTEKQVNYITNKLIPTTLVTDEIKEKHIRDINKKYS